MNDYLKQIADLSGIDKVLTFHIGRHTFATTITLSNGVPIETVSKMLGHKSLRTTQHYAKILDLRVSEDMKALKGKLENNVHLVLIWLIPFLWILLLKALTKATPGSFEIENKESPIPFSDNDRDANSASTMGF